MMNRDLGHALVAHNNLVASIRTAFPDETEESLADTIEGQTQLDKAIIAVLRVAVIREATGKALGELIDGMTARRRRLDEGARSLRAAALQAMQEAGMKKIAAPDFTLSIGAGKPKLVIIDETAIPDNLCRVTKEPNKIAIADAMAKGYSPSWAMFGNATPYLIVHRK